MLSCFHVGIVSFAGMMIIYLMTQNLHLSKFDLSVLHGPAHGCYSAAAPVARSVKNVQFAVSPLKNGYLYMMFKFMDASVF